MVLIFSTPSCSASSSNAAEDAVQLADQALRRHARRRRREADEVGEQDRDLGEAVGDRRLAVIQAPDDRIGQDVAEQRLRTFLLRLQPRQIFLLALAPALALEAGIDAGAQEHEVERLRQVVLGARLDAADHRLGLAQARDHDHRDAVEPLVGLQPLEHLEAVHVGHQQVEEDEVEFLLAREWRAPPAGLPPIPPRAPRARGGARAGRGSIRCRRPPGCGRPRPCGLHSDRCAASGAGRRRPPRRRRRRWWRAGSG